MTGSGAWEICGATTIYSDAWLTLRQEQVRLPNGHHIPAYNIIEERDFCLVIALTTDGLIPLVRQYKHGARRQVLEFPAGLVDCGEDPAAAAQRELLEETGYRGAAYQCLGRIFASPTRARNTAYYFLTHAAVRVADPAPEVTEDISVELVTPAELTRRIAAAEMSAMGSLAGYTLARLACPDLAWE